jgi:hypothetical protein
MTHVITDPETALLTLSQSTNELLSIIAEVNIQIIRQGNKVLLSPQPI